MIKLIRLTKMYRRLRAVDGIDLEVKKGTVFGFLGPNGAGKTTTLRMMAGVLKPTDGRIIINNMDLAREPSRVKRCVSFIPDRPFLYEKLSGREFLNFIVSLYVLKPPPQQARRIAELLELFELSNYQDELIEGYSHGMKQRLVMCAALLQGPKVIIVDEPMVGLDPRGARLVKDIFRDQARSGVTVFMSTHSLEVAQDVCNDIAIIQAGKIIARGNPDRLRRLAGVDGPLEESFLILTEGKRLAHEEPLSSH